MNRRLCHCLNIGDAKRVLLIVGSTSTFIIQLSDISILLIKLKMRFLITALQSGTCSSANIWLALKNLSTLSIIRIASL